MGEPAHQPLLDDGDSAFALDEPEAPPDVVEELRKYADLRHEYDRTAFENRKAKEAFKAQEARLWHLMESLEMKTFSVDDLGKVTRVNKVIGSVVDEEALSHHLIDLGIYEEFRAWRWAAAKLNALVKDSMAESGEAPPGLVPITPIELRFTAPKGQATEQVAEIKD